MPVSRIIAVIPARYAASRFPGKPLALISGKPMVQHVWERCLSARVFDETVIATDDPRIADAVRAFNGTVQLTSPTHASGTDRVAEVAAKREGDIFVNVQGDEPALHPEALHTLAEAFDNPAVQMATLVRPLDEEERNNPNVVKVVRDEQGFARYFSRADLPFARDGGPVERWAHVGLYGYRRATLLKLASLPPTALEKAESLEQLRALGHGIEIFCGETVHRGQAVDSPADVPFAEAALLRLPR